MHIWELCLLAAALSMDALAVAICKGLSVRTLKPSQALLTGCYFGSFQALMPLLGYLLGRHFSSWILRIDHWIAFFLLLILGLNMIKESRTSPERMDASFRPGVMIPLSLATSIDALSVGVTFAFLQVPLLTALLLIGSITFILSSIGVWFGRLCGARFKSLAEAVGGIMLILLGLKILLDHLGYI